MNPPSGVNMSAGPDAGPNSPDADERTSSSSALVPMEQYIWESAESPAGECAAPTDAREDAAYVIEPNTDQEAPLPRILMLSDDDDEPQAPDAEPRDEWRRQFISALHDADREPSSPPPAPEPEAPPPIPYVEPPQRTPPRSFTPNRPARILAPLPVARAPRHRIGLSLLGISAAAGLLSATLPRSANVPEAPADAAGPPVVLALSQQNAPEADSDVIKPVMFNSPVLVREGAAPVAGAPAAALPVIETVRTVPVPLSREARAPAEPASQQAALLDRSPEPSAAPAAAPASPPVNQDSLAALIAQPSAVPPHKPPAQALPPPAAVAPERQTSPTASAATPEPPAAAAAPATTSKNARRTPQIASSYTRAAPKARKQASKRTTRTTSKSASQTKQAQWETRRQGLRTAPPPAEEPSTVVKVLKSLWPFSSDEDAAKAQAAQKKSEAPQPAKTKNSFWWGEKESDR
ncbi:hypothetical protein [Hyphomicrobium sp. CS1BSMeth3]|uniref:hypothetical protein n=1 Tax=Hyphomicrobium sp. CS1BSMeth3 TaxID=1892844 RepID=UPI00093161E4|nr:hypothetical protein [Hyphomicrobium sp. CS1BSMeth3]